MLLFSREIILKNFNYNQKLTTEYLKLINTLSKVTNEKYSPEMISTALFDVKCIDLRPTYYLRQKIFSNCCDCVVEYYNKYDQAIKDIKSKPLINVTNEDIDNIAVSKYLRNMLALSAKKYGTETFNIINTKSSKELEM